MTGTAGKKRTTSEEFGVLGYIGDYCIQSLNSPEVIEQDWKRLQEAATACIYQDYNWVRIASKTFERKNSVFIVTGSNKEGLQFILPMVLEGSTIKTLRWIGGSHANICSGMYSELFLKTVDKPLIESVFKLIGKSIGGIVKTRLGNQPVTLKSHPNPMALLPQQNSVNFMYDMDLRDGLDAILDQGSGKRKRKLWRKQNRVAESMGGFELLQPEDKPSITEALNEFFTSKAKRLSELGVHDVFSDQDTIDFIRELAFEPANENGKLFQIYQLKIASKTRAMYAIGINGKHCQAYVNSVEFDDFADQSPGEMVLYAMIEDLIAQEYETLDLGVGDERYKRSWCPGTHQLFDTIVPLSVQSIPLVWGVRLKNTAKRYIRNNPDLWLKLKKLRKVRASILPTK